MFRSRRSRRVGPLTIKGGKAAPFPFPSRNATSDPADMFVARRLNQSAANFDELLPSTSGTKNHLDGAGDFQSRGASHLQPKRGATLKRLFKSQRVSHRHQQGVTVSETLKEPEPTSPDKKGKSQRGLLKWIYNKLKPRKKSFKSAKKKAEQNIDNKAEQTDPKSLDHCSLQSSILNQDQELEYDFTTLALIIPPNEELKPSLVSPFTGETVFKEIDNLFETTDASIPTFAVAGKKSSDTKQTAESSINTRVKSCSKDLCEREPEKTLENMREQVKDGSSQADDSRHAGNVVIRDIKTLEPDLGSVETVEGNTDTPGNHRLFKSNKEMIFFDTDPSFIENKQHSNAGPAVGAEKFCVSGDTDTEGMLPCHRTTTQSVVTNQQLHNKQDEDQKGSEHTSSKIVGSRTEPSSYSNLVLDPLEAPCQFNTECPPNQGRRAPTEQSFNHLSDNFERRIYRQCQDIYMNAYLRECRKINSRDSSESAPYSPTEPLRNAGATHSRCKGFRDLDLSEKVGPLSESAPFQFPSTNATSDPAHMFVSGRLNQSTANFDELLPSNSGSDHKNHLDLDGAGHFESRGASHLQPIYNKLKPKRKSFKSAKPDLGSGQKAESSINRCVNFCSKDLCERKPEKTLENMREQVKDGSSQADDSRHAGNVVIRDIKTLEPDLGSVETVEGNTDTPGNHRLFKFKKDIFFFDTDPSFIENKQHSNAGPTIGAEKFCISGDTDTEGMLPSHRTTTHSVVTNQQLHNKQDEDQKGSEHISSKIVGSLTETSSYSNLVLDPLEASCQFTTPPNQVRRAPTELSFNHKSNNCERGMYSRCLEMYMNACLRQWHEMNPRGFTASAPDSLTVPPTTSAECLTETTTKTLSSKPKAPSRHAGSTRSRFKGFRDSVRKKLSRLFKMRIVVTIYL